MKGRDTCFYARKLVCHFYCCPIISLLSERLSLHCCSDLKDLRKILIQPLYLLKDIMNLITLPAMPLKLFLLLQKNEYLKLKNQIDHTKYEFTDCDILDLS